MSDDGMVWEDPPTQGKHHRRYGAFWAALRDNPGKWARYPGTGILSSRQVGPAFEIRSKSYPPSSWARYIGESGENAK